MKKIGVALVVALIAGCGGASEPRAESAAETQVVAQWLLSAEATPLDVQQYFAAELVIEGECGDVCYVDGNDIGSGTFNVFLYAQDVDAAVALLRRLHESGRLPRGMRVGVADYTNAERTDWTYRPVYPDDLTSFSPFTHED
jgi:hypothetical protein